MKLPTMPTENGTEWPIDWRVLEILVNAMIEWASRPRPARSWYHHLGPALTHSGLTVQWTLPSGPGGGNAMVFGVPGYSLFGKPGFGWTTKQQAELRKLLIGAGLEVGHFWNGNGCDSVSFSVRLEGDHSWALNDEYRKYCELYTISHPWPDNVNKLCAQCPVMPAQLDDSIDFGKLVYLQSDNRKHGEEVESLRKRLADAEAELKASTHRLWLCEHSAKTAKEVNAILHER